MFVSSYLQGMTTHIVCKTILDMKSTECNISYEDKVPDVRLLIESQSHRTAWLQRTPRDDAVQRGWIARLVCPGANELSAVTLAPILTPGSFQLLSTPLLLSLLWFLPLGVHLISVAPLSSCGLLFSGISTSPSSWVITVANEPQTHLPLRSPQTTQYFILAGPKDRIPSGDSFPH